jgi:hypothetical protein
MMAMFGFWQEQQTQAMALRQPFYTATFAVAQLRLMA